MIGWLVLAGVAAVAFLSVAVAYRNRFVVLHNRCTESWSNVDTELRRRHDLVPNLVAVTKGYAAHERALLAKLTRARSEAIAARQPAARAHAEDRLAALLERLLLVAEAYPGLKASRSFLHLQEELAVTEDRIQAARRFYNANVRDLRDATRTFPGNAFAAVWRPGRAEFFEVGEPALRHVPQVRVGGAA